MKLNKIPGVLVEVCANVIANVQSHAGIKALFENITETKYDHIDGNKVNVVSSYLRQINQKEKEPLKILGMAIESILDMPTNADDLQEYKNKILVCLDLCGLQYSFGGVISSKLGLASKELGIAISELNFPAVEAEFVRATECIERNPREALSSASNIIESICKIYIEEMKLEMPNTLELRVLWKTVRNHLGFNPQQLEDKQLQQILTGLISVVDGISALRSNASSAHGQGKKVYKVERRHARLAVNASHTLSMFILETWEKRKGEH